MTDNEIVKALKCCKLTNEQQESRCDECPLWETSLMICQELLAYHALDLINRQKAEIETRKKNCDDLYEEMSERQKAEVEIAKRMGKAEAIKEFAERLKAYLLLRSHGQLSVVSFEDIDNLVKKMTEETT